MLTNNKAVHILKFEMIFMLCYDMKKILLKLALLYLDENVVCILLTFVK